MTLLGSVVVLLMGGKNVRPIAAGGHRPTVGHAARRVWSAIMKPAPAVRVAGIVFLVSALGATSTPEPAERSIPRTHAHNDYDHTNPLFDALHQGFIGVEA